MVCYKRKPIVLPPPRPLPANINIEVWHINETGEWFTSYNDYLKRMDFYMQHQFTCEITGTSFLTFFEALNSEETQFRLVEEKFPLKLREPVAKFVHFNEIRRVDLLVEQVYARFKADFYPGERVYVRRKADKLHRTAGSDELLEKPTPSLADNSQRSYVVKEKARFNAVVDVTAQQVVKPAFSKYMITEEFGVNSLMVGEQDIYRDRSTFTKHLIKCFCKITLRRASSKIGAPLCVKDEYLVMYGLTLEWPASMLKFKDDLPELRNGNNSKNTQKGSPMPSNQIPQDSKRPAENSGKSFETKRPKNINGNTSAFPLPNDFASDDPIQQYNGPNKALDRAFYYNEYLDHVPFDQPGKRFAHMYKLLEIYQFCQTFGKILILAPFSLDAFISSLKCTDPKETVNISLKASLNLPLPDKKNPIKLEESKDNDLGEFYDRIEKRSPGVSKFLKSQSSPNVSYKVSVSEVFDFDALDDVASNGTSLIVECFIALERLFIDEKGEWRCMVMDKWYDEDELTTKPESKEKKDAVADENSEKQKNEENDNIHDPEIDDLLERCLNFRKLSWSERLSKRHFKNGFWIIVLLGIFQDCMHLPMYTAFVHKFIKAVVPSEGSATHLNKVLWQNFCQNLSLEDKIRALWILVDIASNFSLDIKLYIEDTLEVCTQIRSEKLKLSKRLKSEQSTLSLLSTSEAAQNVSPESLKSKIESHQASIDEINQDREYLTQKLIENDVRRLKSLGVDRNGNKYYWQELSGVQRNIKEGCTYCGSGRLWIRGVSKKDAEKLLKVSANEVEMWQMLANQSSIEKATAEVFKIIKLEDQSLVYVDKDEKTTLMNPNGTINNVIQFSPIQKKVVDETPGRVLLSESIWVSIDKPEDVDQLILWLSDDVTSDQTLAKQLRAIKKPLIQSQQRRLSHLGVSSSLDQGQNLLQKMNENEISEADMKSCQINEEEQTLNDEEELEDIAREIMELDDSSKTRVTLNRIRELEERRDYLLNTRTFKGHANKLHVRAQRKQAIIEVENKVKKQEAALNEYLSARIQRVNPTEKVWTNDLARKLWDMSLYMGAVGKPLVRNKLSVKERIAEIFNGMVSSHQKKS
ncbi:LANO_0E03708g1_1 [Lachancea nothofagi CBS 11611]|uniref:LANO_0E03708g1_1 n=1 Tax=Lachancea nothofagi CBS 11611 TaxID=1266666 RepID=A0A1G4JRR1_9SACH|nr:LANO_0E03708g1_1 [Lachancea nothofagi CBS 11611]